MTTGISIIIPVLNEEKTIAILLDEIRQRSNGFVEEVIVADGGSNDNTLRIASRKGAKVIRTQKAGRARQMNGGARASTAPVLYFLHADTIPPKHFDTTIRNALKKGTDAGCFRLRFDSTHPVLGLYAWFTRFQTTFVRFGDQSLFVTKELFEAVGGFDESLTVMEDQNIVREMKKKGRFLVLNDSVQTSARKYRKNGVLKLQGVFALIFLLYYLGASQQTLIHLYRQFIRTD